MKPRTKRLLANMERLCQDLQFYLEEERTSYTLAEQAAARHYAITGWARRAEQLRNEIGIAFPRVFDLAYPEHQAAHEDDIAEGGLDDQIEGLE